MCALPDPERSRAILIGTSDFESELFANLPAVHNNLSDLRSALSDPQTGILGWEHCYVVDNPDSPTSLTKRLRRFSREAEDFLFVYYAGHGVRHELRDRLYLTTRETDPDEPDTTAVAFDTLRDAVETSPAQVKLLILDCCYSGMAIGPMSDSRLDSREIKVRGTTVIASSPKNRVSLSPPGDRNTAFTAELLTLLTSRSNGRPLDVNNLYGALDAALGRRGMPRPKMQAMDTSSSLLLRREPSAEKPPAEVEPESPVAPADVAEPDVPKPADDKPADDKPDVGADSVVIEPPDSVVPVAVPEPASSRTDSDEVSRIPTVAPLLAESSSRQAMWLWRAVVAVLQWVVFYLCFGYAVGGLAGAWAGEVPRGSTSGDLTLGLVTLFIAGATGIFLYRRLFHHHDRRVDFAEVFPWLGKHGERVRSVLLWVLLVFCAVMVVTGIFAPTRTSAAPSGLVISTLATNVALLTAFSLGAVICASALVRQYRQRKRPL
ncbi:caspase, EACC1-associated type [Amycolatopsis circi]|uniref:caspase, EACC1-associated type n=1 Tax=Amycolatopsis circi TaxID=871959 RepID=UPI0013BEA871|nr:caspase family protein [Amycolatopsis circi]